MTILTENKSRKPSNPQKPDRPKKLPRRVGTLHSTTPARHNHIQHIPECTQNMDNSDGDEPSQKPSLFPPLSCWNRNSSKQPIKRNDIGAMSWRRGQISAEDTNHGKLGEPIKASSIGETGGKGQYFSR